jgi:hypothetical protein
MILPMEPHRLVVAAVITAAAMVALAATRDFEHPASTDPSQQFGPNNVQRQDTPNDPSYDRAEPDDEDGRSTTNLFDERFDLFGFASALTPLARYLDPADPVRFGKAQISGFNAAGAWKIARGRPDVVVAILDTGIRWEKTSLRRQVHLNTGELPLPQNAQGQAHGSHDLDGDGAVTVDDYAADPRVDKNGGATAVEDAVDAQDLIVAFSDHTDADDNGYVDDIAGWDFFNDDNDPYDQSSYFAAGDHGSGRTEEAVEEGNDGDGEIGVCPKCQFMALRVWDTFVSDPNTFGLACLYAADNGAAVIEGADGALAHSAFMEAASEYAYQKGLVQTFSGNDLNTGDHNYPAAYSHVMLIEGTVPDTIGLGEDAPEQAAAILLNIPVGTQLPVSTYFRGANTTQFGGKSSISMEGATGSVNTGKASGAAALVIAAARDVGVTLTPDQVRIILEQTAEDITAPNTAGLLLPDPAQPGWDSHFGWGRVDLGAAVALATSGDVVPEAAIYTPDWYAPLTGDTLHVTGLARYDGGTAFHWKLEWGPGHAPLSWNVANEGDATGTVTDFGDIDLREVRAALASYVIPYDTGGPIFSPTAPDPFTGQFAVRLTVGLADLGSVGVVPFAGIDRRIFTAIDDPTLRPGYPLRLGAGGEAPLRYADLDGDNVAELIVPGMDGVLRVVKKDGTSLPGFPVLTELQSQFAAHPTAPGIAALTATAPAREMLRGVAVADLDDDGFPELVTAAGIHVYVWSHTGQPRAGFPVSMDLDNCRGEDQRQEDIHRKCGFLGNPALGHLDGPDAPLAIVIAGLDGHLYAFRGDGTAVPNFPVNLVDPTQEMPVLAESVNDPAIGDLDGDGFDDVVIATNENYGADNPDFVSVITAGGPAEAFADALAAAAGGSSRLYAVSGKTGQFFDGWPIHLNGAIQDVLPLVGPGHSAALVKVGGTQNIVASTTGGMVAAYGVDGSVIRGMQQGLYGPASNATDRLGQFNLFENATIGDLTGLGRPAVVKYGLSIAAVANLLLVGVNVPYNHLIDAFDAATGLPLPAYPTITDDFQFLSASNIAKIASGASNQILAGTGLGLVHAYDGITGQDVAGFPKITGGWLYAPPEISQDGRIAGITREGFLYEWDVGSPACQTEWPTFRHDPRSSGNYDTDGTPPGAIAGFTATPSGADLKLEWLAPGDDGICNLGAAERYRLVIDGEEIDGVPTPAAQGTPQNMTVSGRSGAQKVVLQGIDEAGNIGFPVGFGFAVTPPPPAPPPPSVVKPPGEKRFGGGFGWWSLFGLLLALSVRARFHVHRP